MYVFGKTIQTAKGSYEQGQPLPLEWSGKETIRQLKEKFGDDVLVAYQDEHVSMSAIMQELKSLKESVNEMKEALGVGDKKKKTNA